MSHYSVLVALPGDTDPDKIGDALTKALAPFDENAEVDPYRDYMDGEATEHWLYTSLKQTAHDYSEGNGAGIKPYKPDEIGYSSASSKDTEEVQLEKQRKDAAVFANLPDPFTWEHLVELYNTYFPEEDRSETYFYEEETGRAYTLSTYNPKSKWDWYQIGGRWNGYFPVKPGHEDDAQLITGGPGVFGSKELPAAGQAKKVDGGPIRCLDLDALRQIKADEAAGTYDRWTSLVDDLPEGKPWKHFVDKIDDESGTYTIDDARREYASQPRVRAAREDKQFMWRNDVIGEFSVSREQYIQTAVTEAVPSYAFLDLDGNWISPGRMGWFGMSSDTEDEKAAYLAQINKLIDSMDPDIILVAMDLHI